MEAATPRRIDDGARRPRPDRRGARARPDRPVAGSRAGRRAAPWPDAAVELVPDRIPRARWTPRLSESGDIDAEEELAEVQASAGPVEESAEEPGAAKKGFFPSSMGLSTLVAEDAKSLSVTVSWGDYARGSYTYTTRDGEQEEITDLWQRAPREQTGRRAARRRAAAIRGSCRSPSPAGSSSTCSSAPFTTRAPTGGSRRGRGRSPCSSSTTVPPSRRTPTAPTPSSRS